MPAPSSVDRFDDVSALLAWALHDSHPPAGRHDRERHGVVYRVACLLVGEQVDGLIARLVRAGCTVAQACEALGSVVLRVSGDPLVIIAELDGWHGPGTIDIVPSPPEPADSMSTPG
jgi:hypothetical protein